MSDDDFEPTRIRKAIAKPFTVGKLAPIFLPVPPLVAVLWLVITGFEVISTFIVIAITYGSLWALTEADPHIQTRLLAIVRRFMPFSFPPGMPQLMTTNRWVDTTDAHFAP